MLEIEKKIQEIFNNLDFVQYSFTKEAVEYFNKAKQTSKQIKEIFFSPTVELSGEQYFSISMIECDGHKYNDCLRLDFWENNQQYRMPGSTILLLLIAEEKFIQTDENKDGETIEIQGHTYKLSLVK